MSWRRSTNWIRTFQVLLTSLAVLFAVGALAADDENKEATQEESKEGADEEAG